MNTYTRYRISLTLALFFLLIVSFGVSIFAFSGFAFSEVVNFDQIKVLSFAAIILFIGVLGLGMASTKLYFLFLPFILFAFPSPVNDFFPAVNLGLEHERGSSVFPFLTHIDIYLLFGVLKGLIKVKYANLVLSKLYIFTLLSMIVSTFINFFYGDFHQNLLLIQGMYQIRYMMLIYLVLSFFPVHKYEKQIVYSLILGILFLLIEATVYTYMKGGGRLSSGSLSTNTFANIISCILVFLVFVRRTKKKVVSRRWQVITIIVGLYIILASQTRIALVTVMGGVFLVYLLIFTPKLKYILRGLMVGVFLIGGVIGLSYLEVIPQRYNVVYLLGKISIGAPSLDLTKFIVIERSWETNPLITRMQLFSTSIKMLSENVMTGIGVGRWNLMKYEYGFQEKVLIDSHNGYLSTISQYGLFGLPLIIFIYFYPVIQLKKHNKQVKLLSPIFFIGIMNLSLSISDLTNSGIFKPQGFALLAFCSIASIFIYKQKKVIHKVHKGNTT